MPISSLRHAFSDTVADVDGFIVRTRLGGGANRGGTLSPAGRRGFADASPTSNEGSASTSPIKRLPSSPIRRQPDEFTRRGSPTPVGNAAGFSGSRTTSNVRWTAEQPAQVVGRSSGGVIADERQSEIDMVSGVATTTNALAGSTYRHHQTISMPNADVKNIVLQPPSSTTMTQLAGAQVDETIKTDADSSRQQPEALCAVNCCFCCNGRLLLMWLKGFNVSSSAGSTDCPPLVSAASISGGYGGVSGLSSCAEPASLQKSRDQSAAFVLPLQQQSTGYTTLPGVRRGSLGDNLNTLHDVNEMRAAAAVSTVTADSDDAGSSAGTEQLGRIQFSLVYNFQAMTLNLKIINANGLAAKDISGSSDPYVKIMLLPDKKRKLVTNIKRKNLNPRWNEQFAFEGFPYNKLLTRTLYLQVMDYDRFSRDDPIGEVCLPLADVDLLRGQTFVRTLQPCVGHTGKLGEILISLCYQPTAEILSIAVLEARQLKSKDINGLSDPYVKIWLMLDGKKVEKRKTPVMERTLNPTFNELFMYRFPYERVRQSSLVISVMDSDRFGRNELIGNVVLGTKSGPNEVKHWNEMFAKTRQPVARWHILRDCR